MRRMSVGVLIGLMLTGCAGINGGGLSGEQQVSTAVSQTQAVQTAIAGTVMVFETSVAGVPSATDPGPSPVTGPGDVPPVTDTPLPTSAVESTIRVSFPTGGTRAYYDGDVGAGKVDEYLVGAMAGQILEVTITPSNGNVFLEIRGEDDTNLIPDGAYWTSFWSSLPSTQDYHVKVVSNGAAQTYSVNISVPAMIYFATGKSDKTIAGHVSSNSTVDYLLYAYSGQELHLKVTTPGVQVALSVTGMNDGQPYLRYVAEATEWTFTLPATQYYKIGVVTIGPPTDFTLLVEVE